MKFVNEMAKIDRRIIYLILIGAVALPLLFPAVQKVRVMPPVEKLYNEVESIVDDQALMLDINYAPSSAPELEPQATAILRHAF